jgi:hypothetical protein
VATGDILALEDCHIISIDEIWLEDLLDKDLLEPLDPGFFGKRGGDWAHDRYVTAAHDLVFRARGKTENLKKHLQGRRYWAIPDRNNCGILAYNPACWHRLAAAQATSESDLVKKCAVWIEKNNRDGRGKPNKTSALKTIRDASCLNWSPFPVRWNQLIGLQTIFVKSLAKDRAGARDGDPAPWSSYRILEPDPGLIRQVTGRRETPTNDKAWGVFTFSMENRECCVSFLLELVLSVLPSRDACDLVDEKGQLKWEAGAHKRLTRTTGRSTAWSAGLVRLLKLLDP